MALGEDTSLPSVNFDTRRRLFLYRVLTASTRRRVTVDTTVRPPFFYRVSVFAECLALGKEAFCRASLFAECLTLGKEALRRVPPSSSAALGKESLRRVPEF